MKLNDIVPYIFPQLGLMRVEDVNTSDGSPQNSSDIGSSSASGVLRVAFGVLQNALGYGVTNRGDSNMETLEGIGS